VLSTDRDMGSAPSQRWPWCSPNVAVAQDYPKPAPSKFRPCPVSLLAGGTDALTRFGLQRAWSSDSVRPFIVEDTAPPAAGHHTWRDHGRAARDPDGYTLLVGTASNPSLRLPSLYKAGLPTIRTKEFLGR